MALRKAGILPPVRLVYRTLECRVLAFDWGDMAPMHGGDAAAIDAALRELLAT